MTRDWELELLNRIDKLTKELEKLKEILSHYGDLNEILKEECFNK